MAKIMWGYYFLHGAITTKEGANVAVLINLLLFIGHCLLFSKRCDNKWRKQETHFIVIDQR